jgi:hypothetical protein
MLDAMVATRHMMEQDEEIARLRQDLAAARALLRSDRDLLSAFDGCSRNNFANLAAEQVDRIDAALAGKDAPKS